MKFTNNLILNQKIQLSQSQIQSLGILAMDRVQLEEYLQNEYLENPMLDYIGDDSSVSITENINTIYESKESDADFIGYSDDSDVKYNELSYESHDKLKDYLLDQLQCNSYSKSQWQLLQYMIECLDNNGFFTESLEKLAEATCIDLNTVRGCLSDLRQLEPYGIFSSDLKHCLLKQLEMKEPENFELWLIVDRHLDDVVRGKINNISRALKIPTSQVRKYIEQIKKLNPRPLSGFDSEKIQYIIPDIIFHKESTGWEIELNDPWQRNYKINHYYLSMLHNIRDRELSEYFSGKLRRIQFISQCIEQRRQTIMTIANEILRAQITYFEGRSPLLPMTMIEIAEKINMHPSTISRAVHNKYLQYPAGSLLLKNLFSAPAAKLDDGNGVSPDQIKSALKNLVNGENKEAPYSDQELVRLLYKRNISISRRTVAKYRTELGIQGSFDRRKT